MSNKNNNSNRNLQLGGGDVSHVTTTVRHHGGAQAVSAS